MFAILFWRARTQHTDISGMMFLVSGANASYKLVEASIDRRPTLHWLQLVQRGAWSASWL
jgi:hypothetical protein